MAGVRVLLFPLVHHFSEYPEFLLRYDVLKDDPAGLLHHGQGGTCYGSEVLTVRLGLKYLLRLVRAEPFIVVGACAGKLQPVHNVFHLSLWC